MALMDSITGKGPSGGASSIISYVTNIKGMMGVAAIFLAIYMIVSDFPMHWESYFNKIKEVETLKANKFEVLNRLQQIQKTSQSIKAVETEIYSLKPGETPQLATLSIAQTLVEGAKIEGNRFIKLTPGAVTTIDYDKVINIPIQVETPVTQTPSDPNVTPQGAASPNLSSAPEGGAVPAGNQPAGTDPNAALGGATTDGATPPNPATSLQAAQYVLVIDGSLQSIAKFIYALTGQKELIFISKLRLYRKGDNPNGENGSQSSTVVEAGGVPEASGQQPKADALTGKQLELELTFLVPWRTGGTASVAAPAAATDAGTPTPPAQP